MEALREPGMIHVKAMCLIVRQRKVLATRGYDDTTGETFYRLIGGGVHFQESSEDALKRELREELETELEHIVFLRVIENSFMHKGQPGHEVIFLFSADLLRSELYEKETIPIADHPSVIAVWVPISEILAGTVRFYPKTDYEAYLKAFL